MYYQKGKWVPDSNGDVNEIYLSATSGRELRIAEGEYPLRLDLILDLLADRIAVVKGKRSREIITYMDKKTGTVFPR